MYNYYQQPQRQLKGHLVASFDEAKASPAEFDGSITFLPDLGNNRIYTKQINTDGTICLKMYELKELPKEAKPDYVTREEFLAAIEKLTNNKLASNF